MARVTKAWAWRSGLIEFGRAFPSSGALPIVSASGESFSRKEISSLARVGYDGKPLVPGVPEAASDDEAMAAFERWLGLLRTPAGTRQGFEHPGGAL